MTDCLLYLTLPDRDDEGIGHLIAGLPSLLEGRPIAALRLEATDPARVAALLDAMLAQVQSLGIAVMLTDLPELARARGCDGVETGYRSDDVSDTSRARKILGDDLQLGAQCGISRDRAMQAGEDGADYVTFGGASGGSASEILELVQWWVGVAELPVVAHPGGTDDPADGARALRAAGADFIACALPADPGSAVAFLDAMGAAIA